MKFSLLLLSALLISPFYTIAQSSMIEKSQTIDSLYREDQIYLGINVNFLNERPKGVVTESFVGGINFGFLRDMPLNKTRNVAIAAGLGYAYNNYGHSLFVGKDASGESIFSVLDSDLIDYDKNRFETHEIELPLELRWRTSTHEEYKFWRIYGGVKLGYAFHFKSVFKQDGDKFRETKIDEFERLRYTAFLNFGYNTFNLQIQYTINSFFNEEAQIDGVPINMTAIKLGLMFYIL
ncbi:MAG: PorT family protein [Flavobacteriaceae bacterium]|nr:PorT family protein [Flavobacteriaceae bacterium]